MPLRTLTPRQRTAMRPALYRRIRLNAHVPHGVYRSLALRGFIRISGAHYLATAEGVAIFRMLEPEAAL